MAITIVGTVQIGVNKNGGDVTLTFDGTPAEDDVVIVGGGHRRDDGTEPYGPTTAGYTELVTEDLNAIADNGILCVFYKVLGASPDSTVTCDGGGDSSDAVTYWSIVLRGVDTASVSDATPTTATGSSTNPDPPSITTNTAGAWVIACYGNGFSSAASAGPSGYSNFASSGETDTRRFSSGVASKEIASASADDPGVFTHSTNSIWAAISVAIKPASAGTPGTATPATVAITMAVPAPTSTAASTVSPATVAATVANPQPGVSAGAVVEPTAVASTTAVPQPTVDIGGTVVSPAVVPATVANPQASVAAGAVVSPAAVDIVVAVPQPAAGAAATTLPATVAITVDVLAPTAKSAKTVSPAAVAVTMTAPQPTAVGGTAVYPATVPATVGVPAPLVGLAELAIEALDHYRFYREGTNLVFIPVGRSVSWGARSSEGFERVSSTIRVDVAENASASPQRAMVTVAAAWAAESGSAASVLQTALHTALQTAGFRGQGGATLS